MRLCAMINRCYTQDLGLLKDYVDDKQIQSGPITESLFSAGFLSISGIDGGDPQWTSGGSEYYLNEYGKLFKQFALNIG